MVNGSFFFLAFILIFTWSDPSWSWCLPNLWIWSLIVWEIILCIYGADVSNADSNVDNVLRENAKITIKA